MPGKGNVQPKWNPLRNMELLSLRADGEIDTARIETDEGLSFSFRLHTVARRKATCVSHSANYNAEYPLHRKIYQRALQVAVLRLRAEQKKKK